MIELRCNKCEHYTGEICRRANPSCIVKKTNTEDVFIIIFSVVALVLACISFGIVLLMK